MALISRLRIAVLFGGRSSEHDVSILSATNVVRSLDPARYDVFPIFVARDGRWLISHFDGTDLSRPDSGIEVALVPGGKGRMLAIPADDAVHGLPAIDLLFPVLHGPHGEDGSVQGLAQAACVPLVGCGLLGSATAMDKDIAKRLLEQAGVPTARGITVAQANPPAFGELNDKLGLPIFIKPARQGSSVGVSKVSNEAEFNAALNQGFRYDRKLVVEEFIKGREIECSILEAPDGSLFVSRPGEIAPAESHGFYSYDAKYVDKDGAELKVPADLPQDVEAGIRDMAARAFIALGCDGMARVDFFLTPDMRYLVNEINTIPGFTDISMYSKAMAASGVAYADVLDRLIEHGRARGA